MSMVLGAAMCGACGGSARADSVGAVESELGVVEPQHGILGHLQEVLAKVNLRADQRSAVDELIQQARLRHQPVEQARQALGRALADQVLSGQIDRVQLKPTMDALLAEANQVGGGDREAFVRLHAILDRTQRNALVDELETFRGRADWMHGHAHEEGKMTGGHGPWALRGPLGQWAKDLSLTESQKDQIRSALRSAFSRPGQEGGPSAHQGRPEMRTWLEQFRQDQLVLPDGARGPFAPDRVQARVDRMIRLAEAVTPILNPDQRAKAAEMIRTMGHARPAP